MIRVYRFRDAPDSLQRLSTHGGDEDWVVVGKKDEIKDSPFSSAQDDDYDYGYLADWGWAQWRERRGKIIIVFAHA